MPALNRLRRLAWSVPVGLQLSALYTLLLVGILALLGAALYTQLDTFLVQNTADRLQRAANSVPVHGGEPGGPRGPGGVVGRPQPPGEDTAHTADLLVHSLTGPDVQVGVLDASGAVLNATVPPGGGSAALLPAPPVSWLAVPAAARGAVQWTTTAPDGGRSLVLLLPVGASAFDNPPAAPLFVEQVASLAAADAVLAQLRFYLALGILAGTVIGVLVGLALTRAVLRPLDRLARAAEAIAAGDLDRRVRLPPGRNEIARLGGTFDHMVDRLSAALESQRRFVADASHELRTPLTSLEGLSELLLMGADKGDTRVVQRTVRAMHGELGRLGRLVADLLTLSRPEAAPAGECEPLDAGAVLASVAEQLEPLAAERRVCLRVEAAPGLWVAADADRLKQVILNLADNALRYTPEGGEVTLHGSTEQPTGRVRLQVEDTGPGIAPSDLPRIFDRFYRGDTSRTRATGNTGLGLSIARSIVEAHGGRIFADSQPGQGACFTVELPGVKRAA